MVVHVALRRARPRQVGTSRCDVPARVQRAERTNQPTSPPCCAAARGADGAARRPYRLNPGRDLGLRRAARGL